MKREQRRDSSPEAGGSIRVANSSGSSPLHSPATPPTSEDNKAPLRRRGTVACRRCRRLRTKCVHGPECQAPCDACRAAGPQAAAECSFPRRGEKDTDRDFRRRLSSQRLSVSSSSSSRDSPGLRASVAPPVQPLPAGASMPVDAPLDLALALAPVPARSAGHHSSLLHTARRHVPSSHASHSHRHFAPLAVPTSGLHFPPHQDAVAACRVFVSSYFQLGFLPKAIFLRSISRNLNSVSPFLLASILSISARFIPSLVRRYGGPGRATDNFLQIARTMSPSEMYKPSLERAQGFFLLAISEWGNGDKDRSSMHMGVAVRMASLLKLHREETYALSPAAPAEQVIRAESARRTFWMIHSQENLQAGYSSPAPFPSEDITARLPCDEHDFAFGVHPAPRSVLVGTVPSQQDPDAAKSQHRCLFATLIQSHHLWGRVARRACRSDLRVGGSQPWEATSEYQLLTTELRSFEEELPERHKWSLWNLRGWTDEQMHLSYLAVVMVLRVSNIVERRIYLDEILFSVNNPHDTLSPRTKGAPETFWTTMAHELFVNVSELFEQIDAFYTARTGDESFPAILVFCVYICGSLASYLWRYPQLCPRVADRAEAMTLRCVQVLGDLHALWPTSTRWNQGLQQIASPFFAASHAESSAGDSSPASCHTSPVDASGAPQRRRRTMTMMAAGGRGRKPVGRSEGDALAEQLRAFADAAIDPRLSTAFHAEAQDARGEGEEEEGEGERGAGGPFWKGTEEMGQSLEADPEVLSNELFEAEMNTLMAGESEFGWLDFERGGG